MARCDGGGAAGETNIPGVSRATTLSARAGLWRTCKTVLESSGETQAALKNSTETGANNGTQTAKQTFVISEWPRGEMTAAG